jgi:hypothetical protein
VTVFDESAKRGLRRLKRELVVLKEINSIVDGAHHKSMVIAALALGWIASSFAFAVYFNSKFSYEVVNVIIPRLTASIMSAGVPMLLWLIIIIKMHKADKKINELWKKIRH